MATLLSSVTTDSVGTGASHSGPATVYVFGTFGDAFVDIEVSPDDTNYVSVDIDGNSIGRLRGPGCFQVGGNGTYYIRASVRNASATTSISASTTQ
jgi:hypothetical protein